MDPRVASLAAITRLNGRLFHHCLDGLSDEAAQERPGPQVNNIAFVAAHLVDSRHYMLALLGDARANPLPAPEGGFNDISKVTRYPTLAEVRAAWDAAGQALEARFGAATAAQLAAPQGEGWPIEEDALRRAFHVHGAARESSRGASWACCGRSRGSRPWRTPEEGRMTTIAPIAPRATASRPVAALAPHLVAVLRGGVRGARRGERRFTDPRPEGGLFGTLAMLSSAQVSRPAGGHAPPSRGHVQHLAFRLSVSTSWIRGEHRTWTWDERGKVRTVTDGEWLGLKGAAPRGVRRAPRHPRAARAGHRRGARRRHRRAGARGVSPGRHPRGRSRGLG
ncbi:MAG: DinB family protein [Gemmatimonadetes bacterium]|nr:DinB family protein [Gemmatimonadota bacterium]